MIIGGPVSYVTDAMRSQSAQNVGLGGTAADLLVAEGQGFTSTGQPYALMPPPPASATFVQQNITVNNVVNNIFNAPDARPANGRPSSCNAAAGPCDSVQISPMAQFLSQFLSILESLLCGQGGQQGQGHHGYSQHGHGQHGHHRAEAMHRALNGWG